MPHRSNNAIMTISFFGIHFADVSQTPTGSRPNMLEPIPPNANIMDKQISTSERSLRPCSSSGESLRGGSVGGGGSSGCRRKGCSSSGSARGGSNNAADTYCANTPTMRGGFTSDVSHRGDSTSSGSLKGAYTSGVSERRGSNHSHEGAENIGGQNIRRVESAGSGSEFFSLAGECVPSTQQSKRRGRGPARANPDPPPEGKRWEIQWNSNGCAIGDNATKLNRRLAAIAKMSDYWPLDKRWLQMDRTSYEKTWNLVVNDFDLKSHPNAWHYIFEVVRERHKGWKAHAKKIFFTPHVDDPHDFEEIELDNRIDRGQFLKCVDEWLTEDSQMIANKNKANRACKKMNQTTGSQAFALVEDKMKKNNKGQPPNKMELMARVYGPNATLHEISDYVTSQQSTESDGSSRPLQEIELEAIEKILGPGRSDRVRLGGIGAQRPPTYHRDRIYRAREQLEIEEKQNVEKEKLESKIKKLEKKNAKYADFMLQLASKVGVNPPDFDDSDEDGDDVSPMFSRYIDMFMLYLGC